MEQFNALSTGRKLILGAGLLLLIDTFFHWQSVDTPIGSVGQSGWHGFWGVLLGLMTIALLAWVAARAFGVALPANVPEGLLTLGLGVLIVLFALIKALSDSFTAWPAYVGIVLAALVAIGGWLNFVDSGEELPKIATAGASASAPPPPAPPAPAAPPGPAAPAAPTEPTDAGDTT
jgi:hypothetical protein